MEYKQELNRQNYKAGYVIVKGIVDGSKFGCDDAKQMAIDFSEDVS